MSIFENPAQPFTPRLALREPVVHPVPEDGTFFIAASEIVNSLDNVLGILIRVITQEPKGFTQHPLPQFPLGSGYGFTQDSYCHFHPSMII